jgi:aminoglycoside/choline kinase family phosphotransferase
VAMAIEQVERVIISITWDEILTDYINESLTKRYKPPFSLKEILADASARKYYRLYMDDKSYVVMDSSILLESLEPFIYVDKLLKKNGVMVPDIYYQDLDAGVLVLEDFGSKQMLSELNEFSVDLYYGLAFDVLLSFQFVSTGNLPVVDKDFLYEELSRCDEWYLGKYLQVNLSKQEQSDLKNLYKILVDSAMEQPFSFMHRDFHARNLMVLPGNNLGVIDFQDALSGPITYDLVSLLKDCYITWPRDKVKYWAFSYLELLQRQNILIDCSKEKFLQWFDFMGLQRHIKCLGNFSRAHLRDEKSSYLKDIPQVLSYINEVCDEYGLKFIPT